jgi:hypothetical protein
MGNILKEFLSKFLNLFLIIPNFELELQGMQDSKGTLNCIFA